MRRRFVTILLVILLTLPQMGYAATPDFLYRQILLELISALRSQIELLKNNSSSLASVGKAPVVSSFLPSAHYGGDYTALYTTSGSDLIPEFGREVNVVHKEIWNIFTQIAGAEFVMNGMSEFRVYTDADAEFDAFIDHIGGNDTWILAVNTYGLDLRRDDEKEVLQELLIHEYGHVVFNNHPSVSAFTSQFWRSEDIRLENRLSDISDVRTKDEIQGSYYKNNRDRFVSAYATTNPLEDIIETFTHFVLYGSSDDGSIKAEKIRFIARYQELYDEVRRIRERVK